MSDDRLPNGVYSGTYNGAEAKIVVSDSSNSYRRDIYTNGNDGTPDGPDHDHTVVTGDENNVIYMREGGETVIDQSTGKVMGD